MSYSATVTLGSSYTGLTNIDNFTIQAIGSDGVTVRTTFATGVTRTDLGNGYGISGVESTDTFIRVTSNSTCVNSVDYALPGATPTPTPSPVVSAQILTVTSGTYPASGGSGTSVQGTIRVTGGNVNLWAKHISGGNSSGTSNFSGTFNSITVTGTYTILTSGQPGWTNSGGTTSSGYVTLTPGDYGFTITKTDNLTSGATVSISWSTGTTGNLSTTLAYLN